MVKQLLRDEIGACLTSFTSDEKHTARTSWLFPRTFTGFKGHFPGTPVCPGVCLIIAQLEAASRLAGSPLELLELSNIKFTWPVFPDKQVDGQLRITPLGNSCWRIQAQLNRGERRIAKFLLVAREIEVEELPHHA